MSLRILKSASAAALMGAGLSVSLATPGQAAVSCLVTGAQLFAPGYTCTAGDKIYSNFSILSGGPSLEASGVTVSDNDPNHTISFTGSFAAGNSPFSFSYQMDLLPAFIGIREFHLIKTGATTSATGTNAWTKTLSAVPVTSPGSVVSTEASPGGESGTGSFSSGVTSAVFTSTLSVSSGEVTNFTDSLTQDRLDRTPGPLPILGAGAAFGFSRKLRRRVSASC